MNTPRDNDKVTLEFRVAMLEKLNANNHKRHWDEAALGWLMDRLDDERRELREAVADAINAGSDDEFNTHIQAAMKECADIANMAMMVWDNLRHGVIDGSDDTEYLEPSKA